MTEIFQGGVYKESENKIRKESRRKVSPANSLKTLAGGWSRKEADEFFESLEPFDSNSKTPQE